jgi:hypothetical protein
MGCLWPCTKSGQPSDWMTCSYTCDSEESLECLNIGALFHNIITYDNAMCHQLTKIERLFYTENAETPYSATVVINDVKYGTGYASSKKAAKLEAGKLVECISYAQ